MKTAFFAPLADNEILTRVHELKIAAVLAVVPRKEIGSVVRQNGSQPTLKLFKKVFDKSET